MNGGALYIGIDPDLDKSGIAVWESQNEILTLKNLSFWQLFDLLSTNRDRIVVVRIEAGWLNFKSNWHNRYRQTKEAGEAISTGKISHQPYSLSGGFPRAGFQDTRTSDSLARRS